MRQMERRERALNAAGAIAWNDSANHKRFGWRGEHGYIVEAYGVDLSPLGAMAAELLEADKQRKAELGERSTRAQERRKALAARRSVKAMLACAVQENLIDPDAQEWRDKSEFLSRDIPTCTPFDDLRDLNTRFRLLADELKNLLRPVEITVLGKNEAGTSSSKRPEPKRGKTVKMSPWGDINVAHIDNTNLESSDKSVTSTPPWGQSTAHGGKPHAPFDAKSSMKVVDGRKNEGDGHPGNETKATREDRCARGSRHEPPAEAALANDSGPPPVPPGKGRLWKPDTGTRYLSPLSVVETAGPRMLAAVSRANRMAETDQPDWRGIEEAAEDLCSDLGIGSQVWLMAVTVMGRRAAAICVMLIDRKMCPDAENPVRCPGAYLRGMTDRARHDKLHLHASVFGWGRRVAA